MLPQDQHHIRTHTLRRRLDHRRYHLYSLALNEPKQTKLKQTEVSRAVLHPSELCVCCTAVQCVSARVKNTSSEENQVKPIK